jgi:(+)-neomenthol dehydrogenase
MHARSVLLLPCSTYLSLFAVAGHRIAVVTGGNKGIGLEVCRQLADSGVAVVLTARDETRGAAAVEKLRGLGLSNVIFHQLDITDAPSIARLVVFFKTRFGKLDILVNNAGFVGLEYIQDHIDGTSTTSEKVRRFLINPNTCIFRSSNCMEARF